MSEDKVEGIELPTITQEDSPVDTSVDEAPVEDGLQAPPLGMNDPGWHAYVMAHFEPDELMDGNPKADGLRRLVGLLLGNIVVSQPVEVQHPCLANNYHASVVWNVIIDITGEGALAGGHPYQLNIGDMADVSPDNTQEPYSKHPTSTASTKAEGRCYKKALKLKNILTADEAATTPVSTPGQISIGQITFIDMMCGSDRNDIDVMKLINIGRKNNPYKSINEVSFDTAQKIGKFLGECLTKPDKIPASIKGYNPDWRQSE